MPVLFLEKSAKGLVVEVSLSHNLRERINVTQSLKVANYRNEFS